MAEFYSRIYWLNKSESLATPLGKTNLNKMDSAIKIFDGRTVELYTESLRLEGTKADKAQLNNMIVDVGYNDKNGVITLTKYDGTVVNIDTAIEKMAVNFAYDATTQQLVVTLEDGTKQYADMSALVTQYEFLNTDTIAITVNSGGKISIAIKNGSVTKALLAPEVLSTIITSENNAKASADSSAASADAAAYDAKLSQSYSIGGSGIRDGEDTDNSKYYKEQAQSSATDAASSATTATEKTTQAMESASEADTAAATATEKAEEAATAAANALVSAANATDSATDAASSATTATEKATQASTSADEATDAAASAAASATEAESFTHGGTGTRENEDTDNAEYYYNQAKHISQGMGGLIPMGTITFADLSKPENQVVKNMYNISDAFISDEQFEDGGGIYYGVGSNVYYTAKGTWDVLASSMVSGVKGDAETEYRQGLVNITPENIGAINKEGDTVNGKITFQQDYQVHWADAGNGNNGFIIIAQIKITHAYSDSPLQLTIFRRGCRPTELYIRFINTDTLTPGLQDFVYTGDDCKAYIVQLSPGVWTLYISKAEACDNIAVVSAKYDHAYGSPEIIWKNDFAGSVTGGGRYASYYPVLQSKYIIDSDDNIPINITFNKAGQASTDWLASWNEHELGSISPKNIAAGKVFDYGNTSKAISIGYAGAGLTSSNATHFAAYTESGTKIKDLSPGEARKLISAMGLKNTNGYYGMTDISGTDSVWIRTTNLGIIPYQTGNRGGGHQSLGSSTWYFFKSYIDNMYGVSLDLSGTFTTSTTTGTYINGAKGTNVIINSTAPGSGYNILAKLNSNNGIFNLGYYTNAIHLYYISNSKINANSNSFDKDLVLLNESGNSSFPGTVSANAFSAGGSSSLTTLTATNVTINGNIILGGIYLMGSNYFEIRFNNSTTVGVAYHFYAGNEYVWYQPLKDNRGCIGSSDYRWTEIYCMNSSISTSDAREKKEISYIGKNSGYEDTYMSDETLVKFINGLMACIFKRKNGESGRPHHGFIAQDVENLMQILGIKDHAGFIKSPKTIDKETEKEVINDEGNKEIVKEMIKEEIPGEYIYGLRYEEFISDIVRYCQILFNENEKLKNTQQIQQEKIDSLESRLSALEIKMW